MEGKRNYYACEVCNLVSCNLSTHLKRKCMKGKSKDDVDAALLRARDRVYFHIRDHLVITYDFVKERLKLSPENLAKVVKLLEELGHTVTKKPPAVQPFIVKLPIAPRTSTPKSEPMQEDLVPQPATSERSTDEEDVRTPIRTEANSRTVIEDTEEEVEEDSGDEGQPQSADEAEGVHGPGALEPQEDHAQFPDRSSPSSMESNYGRSIYARDSIRKKMRMAGLYRQHPITDSYLGQFVKFLLEQEKLKEQACRNMAQNVSKLMYYVDSSRVNLHALQPEKVQEFFSRLNEAGLSFLTKRNYHKCVKRFLGWVTTGTDIFNIDRPLYMLLRHVEDCLAKWSRELLAKRVNRHRKTVEECQVILRVAANDFKSIIHQTGEIRVSDYILVLNYLTALLCLKHFQRRSVAEYFKVEEWATGVELRLDGKKFWTFYAKENQAGNTQPATFCLDEDEYWWFQRYFDHFRPPYAAKEDAHTACFFLSTMGKKIHNAANDLNRFHRKYKLAVNTAGEARRAMQASARARLEGNDLELVEDYLAHAANVDDQFYEFNQPINVCRAMLLMTGQSPQLLWAATGPSNGDSKNVSLEEIECNPPKEQVISEVSARHIPAAHYASTNGELSRAFDKLAAIHPVTLDGKPPSKTLASMFYFIKPKSIIDKWAYAQRAIRVQHITDLFPRRRPRRAEISKILEENNWPPSLLPKVAQKWVPTSGRQNSGGPTITLEDRVAQQNWPGLCIGRNQRGNVIFTGKAFRKGEIVLDYHGEMMSFDEGLKRQNEVTEDGYIFFLRHKDLAIDASKEHCKCHPKTILYGRLISHSRKGKRMNLKPEAITIAGKTCIVFRAMRDLKAGEELFFDYGVRRKQFNEGHDLSWIDS